MPSIRKTLAYGGCGLTLLALGLCLGHPSPEPPAPPAAAETAEAPTDARAPARPLTAAVVQQQDDEQRRRLDPIQPRLAPAEHPQPEVMRASFKRMHAVASYFNRDALRREEMRELLDDPGIVASAQRAVTDLAYAQQTFGEDQAMARVYALQLLVEAARQGNNGPMRESIASLTETLDQLARTGQPPQKAQDRDLADLLNAAVAQIGAERLEADLTGTLAELGYRPILAPEVRKLFDDAVFFPLLDRLGRAEASRRVAQALAGDA